MSVTVGIVVPSFISYIIAGGYIAGITGAIASAISSERETDYQEIDETYHFSMEEIRKLQEKEIETVFVDKDTLVKTLEEYGANITAIESNKIECSVEDFEFTFYKIGDIATSPYKLKIKYNEEDSLKNLLENIHSEYTSNTQEASYNKVIQRLEEKNMQYEEEVYDDDTIVLTVNLD